MIIFAFIIYFGSFFERILMSDSAQRSIVDAVNATLRRADVIVDPSDR